MLEASVGFTLGLYTVVQYSTRTLLVRACDVQRVAINHRRFFKTKNSPIQIFVLGLAGAYFRRAYSLSTTDSLDWGAGRISLAQRCDSWLRLSATVLRFSRFQEIMR